LKLVTARTEPLTYGCLRDDIRLCISKSANCVLFELKKSVAGFLHFNIAKSSEIVGWIQIRLLTRVAEP